MKKGFCLILSSSSAICKKRKKQRFGGRIFREAGEIRQRDRLPSPGRLPQFYMGNRFVKEGDKR